MYMLLNFEYLILFLTVQTMSKLFPIVSLRSDQYSHLAVSVLPSDLEDLPETRQNGLALRGLTRLASAPGHLNFLGQIYFLFCSWL